MTRLWIVGIPIAVVTDRVGNPQTIIWTGKRHAVAGIANRWRLDQEWWRGRIWRDYVKLYTHTGILVVIYRDLLSGDWYLERLYD